MVVHYKFRSTLNYDMVSFDGLHISVSDLKKAIMQQKRMKSSDSDLKITNAQTDEVYESDGTLIPKNTSVIVMRVPTTSTSKKTWKKPELPLRQDECGKNYIRHGKKNPSTNVTEEEKLKAMIEQSSQEYNPSKYMKNNRMIGPVPLSYTCYRCRIPGHWIKDCPTNSSNMKRTTGIPRSFLVSVDGPEHKGARLSGSGDYVVPIVEYHAYKEVKKEKPHFISEPAASISAPVIPAELLCMICKSLLQEAVSVPCCRNSFCDECLEQALLDSDDFECPMCHEINIFLDTVIPNLSLRTAVLKFQNVEAGYACVGTQNQQTTETATHCLSPQHPLDLSVENQQVPEDRNSSEIKDELPKSEKKEPALIVKNENEEAKNDWENINKILSKESTTNHGLLPITPLCSEHVDVSTKTLPAQEIGFVDNENYKNQHDDSQSKGSESGQPIETIIMRNFARRQPNIYSRRKTHYSTGIHHQKRQNLYEKRGQDLNERYQSWNPNQGQPSQDHRLNQYHMYQNEIYGQRDNRRDYVGYTNAPGQMQEGWYDTHLRSFESRPTGNYALDPYPSVNFPAAVVPVATQASYFPPQGFGPVLPGSILPEISSSFTTPLSKLEEVKPKQEDRSRDDRLEAFESGLDKQSICERASRDNSRARQHTSYAKNHSSPSRNYKPRKRHSQYPVRRHNNPPVENGTGSYTKAPFPDPMLGRYSPIKHGHRRYERSPEIRLNETSESRKDYSRRKNEMPHHIQSSVEDRGKEFKQRLRPGRDPQRREIKELPKPSKPVLKSTVRVPDSKEKQQYLLKGREGTSSMREVNLKRKEETRSGKRKRSEKSLRDIRSTVIVPKKAKIQ